MGMLAKRKSKQQMEPDQLETALSAHDLARLCELLVNDVELKSLGWRDKVNNKQAAMLWIPAENNVGGSLHRVWMSASDGNFKPGSTRDEAFRIDVRFGAENAEGRRTVDVVTGRATLDDGKIRFVDNHEFTRDQLVARILQLDPGARLTRSRKDSA